jgi:hypothetical protein
VLSEHDSEFWGAHDCSVLVAAFRRNELPYLVWIHNNRARS